MWEIEIGEVHSAGDFGQKAIDIWAVKEGEKLQGLVCGLGATANAVEIEVAARKAVAGVNRLNAGFASAKPGIAEKLREVIDNIQQSESG